jgi:hypothetical protein
MQTIRPGIQFRIPWQISASDDVGTTYYPQAVIRASVGNSIIETLNLSHDGNGRYSALWLPPGDSSGLGYQIDMTINVYTDSGHITLSPNYSIENRVYVIKEENRNFGATNWFDWEGLKSVVTKIVEKVFDEKIKKLPPPTVTEKENAELPEILNKLKQIKGGLPSIDGLADKSDIETLRTDFINQTSSLESVVGYLQDKIENSENDNSQNFDVINTAIENLKNEQLRMSEMFISLSKQVSQSQAEFLTEASKIIQNEMQKVLAGVDSITYSKGVKPPQENVKSENNANNYLDLARKL